MSEEGYIFHVSPGDIKKGDYLLIKDCPCKAIEVTHSKVGKHGSAKTHIVGIDIFTEKKYEHTWSASQQIESPYTSKKEYILVDINGENVSAMDEKGDLREDLVLPETDALYKIIKERFDKEDELAITVISAMGKDRITAVKTDNN